MVSYKFNPFTGKLDLVSEEDLSGYFLLNQSTPQTVTGGSPIFDGGLSIGDGQSLTFVDGAGNKTITMAGGTFSVGGNITTTGILTASQLNIDSLAYLDTGDWGGGQYYITGYVNGSEAFRADEYGFLVADGTNSAPSHSFLSDVDTGFYLVGAGNVGLSLGGTLEYDFSSTQADFKSNHILTQGSLEIGANTPEQISNISGVITYGSGNYTADPFPPGISIAVYSYKDIGGTRIYNSSGVYGSVSHDGSGRNYYVDWTFTDSSDADGYIITYSEFMGSTYYKDVSAPASVWNDQGDWSLTPPPSFTPTALGTHIVDGVSLTVNCPTTLTAALTGTTISATTLQSTGLTSGRMVYTGFSGTLSASGNALYNGTTLTLAGSTGTAYKSTSGAMWLDGTSGNTPASGSGTRLMWIPAKAAFRAGVVNSTQWDNANIGTGSAAFSENNTVSGNYSVAFGSGNNVSGTYSVAFGNGNTISTLYSAAFGLACSVTTSGYSMVWGGGCVATGTASTAGGYLANCTSFGGLAVGVNFGGTLLRAGTASADGAYGAVALGVVYSGSLISSGNGSLAVGYCSGTLQATGNGSVAMGYSTGTLQATGLASFALGSNVQATANYAFALGTGFTNSTASTIEMGITTRNIAMTSTQTNFHKSVNFDNGTNIQLGGSTGTKIGTATNHKLGFWNTTPIIQPTTGVAESAFTENAGGTVVNDDSTFDGYTLRQVVKALRNAGLLA